MCYIYGSILCIRAGGWNSVVKISQTTSKRFSLWPLGRKVDILLTTIRERTLHACTYISHTHTHTHTHVHAHAHAHTYTPAVDTHARTHAQTPSDWTYLHPVQKNIFQCYVEHVGEDTAWCWGSLRRLPRPGELCLCMCPYEIICNKLHCTIIICVIVWLIWLIWLHTLYK